MPLSQGTRLGPYEILTPLGTGGMGEVYKARDTRLDRIVALKASKTEFSERFEREARAIAALNHPHICQLYDVGPDYLVMEYVEGAPLKGPLPVDQALQYAVQICEALETAHRKGIVHRDLKPANILVTKAGVKLLDFGLAKIGPTTEPAGDATLTMALTGKNEIVGTLYYMSPEQLQAQGDGRTVDPRSDIFSLGLVLYEMITGKRAFDGSSAASVIAGIMERSAPSVGDVAPPALDRVLRQCLAKDPDERWQNARDLGACLQWVLDTAGPVESSATAKPQPVWKVAALAASAAFVVVAAALGYLAWRHNTEPALGPVNLAFSAPPAVSLATQSPAVSPDGKHVVFVAGEESNVQLWVRDLASPSARPLPGTDAGTRPFWSSDSRSVGFFQANQLKRTEIAGGPVIAICAAPGVPRGGTWSASNGVILFAINGVGIFEVPAAGGTATLVTKPNVAAGEQSDDWPWFLPDGSHFLFTVRATPGHIDVADLGSGERRRLVQSEFRALFASGALLFLRGQV